MGFLSSWRSARQPAAPAQPAENKPTVSIDLHKGMSIAVLNQDRSELLCGKLSAIDRASLTLERLPGALSFPVCTPGTEVLIQGCTAKMVPYIIRGEVAESTRILFKMSNLKMEQVSELRDNFRLEVKAPASLFYEQDEYCQNPESCTLVDISIGGACVESEYLHGEGEVLRLRVKVAQYAPMDFLGEIIRVTEPSPGVFRYGFLFAQLTEEATAALAKTLYNVQTGNRRARTQEDQVHW